MNEWRKHTKYDGAIEIHEWVPGWGVNLVAENVKPAYADLIVLAPRLYELARQAPTSRDSVIAGRAADVLKRDA